MNFSSLNSYIMNAAGPKDVTLEDLQILGESGSSTIVMKSCTLEPREGNPKPRWKELPLGGIQGMGLPNLGYKFYVDVIPKLQKHDTPIIASVSGMSLEDNLKIIEAFQGTDVDAIELNLSCPNIKGKPQVGYDMEQTDEVLTAVQKINNKPLGIKLPPYHDGVHVAQMAALVKKHKIDFITTINSIGNCLIIDAEEETPIIKAKNGYGGLSGDYVKPVALGNVRMFYEELKDTDVQIIGVGGINNGTDAFEFLLAGAHAVQVGTVFVKEGPECFDKINDELNQILKDKGYSNREDARGQLKVMTREPDESEEENL